MVVVRLFFVITNSLLQGYLLRRFYRRKLKLGSGNRFSKGSMKMRTSLFASYATRWNGISWDISRVTCVLSVYTLV